MSTDFVAGYLLGCYAMSNGRLTHDGGIVMEMPMDTHTEIMSTVAKMLGATPGHPKWVAMRGAKKGRMLADPKDSRHLAPLFAVGDARERFAGMARAINDNVFAIQRKKKTPQRCSL